MTKILFSIAFVLAFASCNQSPKNTKGAQPSAIQKTQETPKTVVKPRQKKAKKEEKKSALSVEERQSLEAFASTFTKLIKRDVYVNHLRQDGRIKKGDTPEWLKKSEGAKYVLVQYCDASAWQAIIDAKKNPPSLVIAEGQEAMQYAIEGIQKQGLKTTLTIKSPHSKESSTVDFVAEDKTNSRGTWSLTKGVTVRKDAAQKIPLIKEPSSLCEFD